MYPVKFQKLIELFEKLPGVGNKTATRYAFRLMNENEETINDVIDSLKSIKSIKRCKLCGFLSEDDICGICKDNSRDKSTIMVVSSDQDVVAIERTNSYKGMYHVLGGLLSSSKGIFPEDLKIKELEERLKNTKEVILALESTMDGEMTTLYLDKILKEKNILVTRLASGLPMGANLDYADELTLIKAFNNRNKIN